MFKLIVDGGLHFNKSILIRPILVNRLYCYSFIRKKKKKVHLENEKKMTQFHIYQIQKG